MKIKYLLIFSVLFGLFTSCSDEVNQNVKKKPCIKTGVYCKGADIYTCHNNRKNEGIEELLESCDNGQVCFNQECIAAQCDEIVNCVEGERRCNDNNSFKICGNYDSDNCLEWDIRSCGDNLVCNNGLCVPGNNEDPCNLMECMENSTCKVNDTGVAECICNEGYKLNSENQCEAICTPKSCSDFPGIECGRPDDGCGNKLDCGTCSEGSCIDGRCVTGCIPKTCDELENIECGDTDNGCGGILSCGGCQQLSAHCFENQCVSLCEHPNPCTEENKNICEITGNAIHCKCNEGFHFEGNDCVANGYCDDVSCGEGEHCDVSNGDCIDNTKMVNCTLATPQHGITENENLQVEVTWENDHWSLAEECPWSCATGYKKEGNECLPINCSGSQHLEGNDCVGNERTVSCDDNGEPDVSNAHYVVEDITITWNNGWPDTPECNWVCDQEYHKYTDPNLQTTSCVSDTQSVLCQPNEDLPENAIENTEEIVEQTWVYDSENSEEGYWITPYCEWYCDAAVSCLSSDATSCITKEATDICDGEDNDCDGIVDNTPDNPQESSSCGVGELCFGRVYGGHRYMFCNTIFKTWNEAEAGCANHGGHLVSINNEAEEDFIKSNIDDRYWIGYYQTENGGSAPWYWSDESTPTYTNWADGEPNNYCLKKEWSWSKWKNVCVKWENCAEMYSDGSWNDAGCDIDRRFICELPLP